MTHKFTTKLLMSLTVILALFTSQPTQSRPQNFTRYENAVLNNNAWSDSDAMEDDGETRKCCKVCASEVLAGRVFTRDLTVSGTSIFEGPATFNDVVTFNGDVNIDGTETVENLVVTNATDFPPAPALITVNPALPEDRFAAVPNFQTIQGALDWLQNKKIVNTTIDIAPGTYPENLVVGPALVGDPNNLQIFGDMRDIAGCGINHGSYWNSFDGSLPVGGAPANAGEAQFIGAAGSATLTVNGIGGCVSPDFAAAGVTSADKVLIRHNDGTFAEYSITSAVGNTLGLSPVLAANANGLGAAMCITPRVKIAPATGTCIYNQTKALFAGLYVVGVGASSAFVLGTNSQTNIDNVLMYTQVGRSIISNPTSGRTFDAYVYTFRRNFGFTAFRNNPGGMGSVSLTGAGTEFYLLNCLVAAAPGGQALAGLSGTFLQTIDCRFIGVVAFSTADCVNEGGIMDVIVHSGSGVRLNNNSSLLKRAASDSIRVRGAATGVGPTIGIDVQSGDFMSNRISFTSANASAIALRVGDAGNRDQKASAVVSFGPAVPSDTVGINTASSTAPMVQVLNGSILQVEAVSGTITLGGTAQGFQVFDNSQLIWRAGSFTPTVATTGTLFDIQRNSSVIVSPGAARSFTNFNRFFNLDKNSILSVSNTTTTSPGAAQYHYQIDNFSHAVVDSSTQVNGLMAGDNITNGSGMRRIASGTVYASADASSQSL